MEAFWANGYDTTSLDDLMRETGLSRSSLYNAFGDKLDLFIAALETYARGPARDVMEPLITGHGASAMREFLQRLSSFVESPAACRGCLMVNTALDHQELSPSVRRRVRTHFMLLREGLERTYREAVKDGDLEHGLRPTEVADWLVAFVRGVLVSAGSGVDAKTLQTSIRLTSRQLGLSRARVHPLTRR